MVRNKEIIVERNNFMNVILDGSLLVIHEKKKTQKWQSHQQVENSYDFSVFIMQGSGIGRLLCLEVHNKLKKPTQK